MRISPEPLDDRLVLQFVIEVALDSVLPEQLHGDVVNLRGFAVHERHVEEAGSTGFRLLSAPTEIASCASASANVSCAKDSGEPLNMFLENWSSTMISASLPRASFLHSKSSQRVARR